MKAVLVIDEMPTGCIGCPCYYEDKGRCQNTWESVEDDFARPSWCPLKPLPQKRINKDCLVVHEIWNEGYNACLEDILGGE